jgi:GAF domain-containing protein
MTSTPPLADQPQPSPDVGAAPSGVLVEPAGRRWSRLRTYLLLEAAAVAVGYGVAVLRDGAPATAQGWGLVLAGAVAVAVPLWVKSRRELRQAAETRSAEALAIETDAKLRLVVGDVVTPIAEVVGRVHQASAKVEREQLRGQLKQLVVEAVASLCDGERARAVFFQLDNGEMRAAAWFGRGDPPTTVFTDQPGDRRGQEALLLVRFHDYLLIDDVRADELPRGAEPRPGAGYRSFISVAVFSGDQNLGMLSVDAPEPHAFDDTDLNVMRAMAQLLGAGLVDRR